MKNTMALVDAARRLRVPYQSLWVGVARGAIRAERHGSRWVVAESDLPEIREILGTPAGERQEPQGCICEGPTHYPECPEPQKVIAKRPRKTAGQGELV